jgi:peptidoglycan/LPS O-acetylase OafA/YrhL
MTCSDERVGRARLVMMSQVDSVSPVERVSGGRTRQREFRPDIEGLRAVAVLAVVLFHAGVPGLGGGFVGVDVFFVISGFLITGMLCREVDSTGGIRLARFYGARARRLLPASATVGVITALGSAILLSPLEVRSVLKDGIACALYVGNYRFAQQHIDYLASDRAPSPFQHYWSLGVEEQFYLIWPPLIIAAAWLLARRRRNGQPSAAPSSTPYLVVLAAVAAASLTASLISTHTSQPVAFFSLATRAWQLAAGGLIALTATHWRRLPPRAAAITGWSGLAVILVACNQLGATTPYPGTAALLPVAGAALIIAAGCARPTQGCGRLLKTAPMRAIGQISYSWYLWHWPILLLAPPLLGHPLGLAERLAAAALSAGLAVLTLGMIENPIRFAAPLRRSATASLTVGATATATAVAVGIALLVMAPAPVGRSLATQTLTIPDQPPPPGATPAQYSAIVDRDFAQVQAAIAASADLDDVPANLDPPLAEANPESEAGRTPYWRKCMVDYLQVDQPECAIGDSSWPTVDLIGDSNAWMWITGFQQAAAQRHWRLEMLEKGACPVLDLPTLTYGRDYTECKQWSRHTIDRLQRDHPKLIVLSMSRRYGARYNIAARFESYDPAWIDSITRLVRQLRGTGAQVLVLGPIPDPQSVVPTCLAEHLDDATTCSAERSVAVNDAGIAAETAATKAGGGQYADVTDLFCTPQRCPAIIGNTLAYFDRKHTTIEYSQLLAPVLGALADRALAGQ